MEQRAEERLKFSVYVIEDELLQNLFQGLFSNK